MDCRMYGLYECAIGQLTANDSLAQFAFFYNYYILYMQTYSLTKENVPKWKHFIGATAHPDGLAPPPLHRYSALSFALDQE